MVPEAKEVDQRSLEARIRLILRENLHISPQSEGDELLASGMIDSLGLVEVVVLLEKEFSIQVRMDDLDPENFRTLSSIAGLVRRELGGNGARE